jgi:hypothetical protein
VLAINPLPIRGVEDQFGILLLLRDLRTGPAHGLAVDGDHFGWNPRLRGDPGDKATLECLGFQRGENVAEVIVRRGSILEGSEAPEKSQFQPAEFGDVGDCLRPGDDGEQAQQQDLIERIFDLAPLPHVRQILEIAEENNRFAKRPDFISRTLHRNPPICESVDFDDSELC